MAEETGLDRILADKVLKMGDVRAAIKELHVRLVALEPKGKAKKDE